MTLENITLNVQLPFTIVTGIKSNLGCPQGMKISAFAFCTILWSVMEKVIEQTPDCDWLL